MRLSEDRRFIELEEDCCSMVELGEFLSDLPSYVLRELLCDVCSVSHATEREELLRKIGERI